MANNNGTIDLNEFFSGIAESDEIKKVEIAKVSTFEGDITKTIVSAEVTNSLKFVAPKGWTEENAYTLHNLFDAVRTKKGIYKKTDISLPYQRKKDGAWCISFETTDNKEFYGTEKVPSLQNTIRFIIENLMESEVTKTSFRRNKVAKIGFSFSDLNEKPLSLGEKGYFGFFIINDLMKPVTQDKSGRFIKHMVSGELLINNTKLPDGVQMNTKFERSSEYPISVKSFANGDTVAVRRTFQNVLYVVAFDVVDFEEVEEISKNKKGKKSTKIVKLPKIGYHVATIKIDPKIPSGWIIDNKKSFENDGVCNANQLEYALTDIINSKIDKRYRTWVDYDQNGNPICDEEGKTIKNLIADRIINETNLSQICVRIDEVQELAAAGKFEITDDENSPLSRRQKFIKPFTIGDAVDAADEEEVFEEEPADEAKPSEQPIVGDVVEDN